MANLTATISDTITLSDLKLESAGDSIGDNTRLTDIMTPTLTPGASPRRGGWGPQVKLPPIYFKDITRAVYENLNMFDNKGKPKTKKEKEIAKRIEKAKRSIKKKREEKQRVAIKTRAKQKKEARRMRYSASGSQHPEEAEVSRTIHAVKVLLTISVVVGLAIPVIIAIKKMQAGKHKV